MVITEAFAAASPVIASDIPGYRDAARPGVDGILVPPGDARALAEALYDLAQQPARRAEMAQAATRGVARLRLAARGWRGPGNAYRDATETPKPAGRMRRAAVRVGACRRRICSRGLPPAAATESASPLVTATAASGPWSGGSGWAWSRSQRPPWPWWRCARSASSTSPRRWGGPACLSWQPGWPVMCASMVLRAVPWHAVLRGGAARCTHPLPRHDAGPFHRRPDFPRSCPPASASRPGP